MRKDQNIKNIFILFITSAQESQINYVVAKSTLHGPCVEFSEPWITWYLQTLLDFADKQKHTR